MTDGMLWRARIDIGSHVAGSGTLVAPDLVLTAAHVLTSMEDLYVTFPGVAERLSAVVEWKGAWEGPGDERDIAVLRIKDPLPEQVQPCLFEFGTALRPRAGQASIQVRALGFPPRFQDTGTYVTLGTSEDRWLRGEWLEVDVEQAHLRQLTGGFSGAAAYLPESGAVVGIVTDAELVDGHGFIGKILPLDTIRRHWEPLDDLLLLDWLPAAPRQELRLLVSGMKPSIKIREIFDRAFPQMQLVSAPFASLWEAIRYIGEEMSHLPDRIGTFLRELVRSVDEQARLQLIDWIRRYTPAAAATAVSPAPQGSVVVRAERRRDEHLDVVCYSVLDGIRVKSSTPERIAADADQIRAWVERVLAAQISPFTDENWMIEFVVPRGALMGLPFDEWSIHEPGEPRPMPMRTKPVVVRDVGRLEPSLLASQANRRRWERLRHEGRVRMQPVDCAAGYEYEHFYGWLDDEEDICALVYPSHPKPDWLEASLRAGIPIMLWHRADCPDPHPPDGHQAFLDGLAAGLADAAPEQLPVLVMKLRKAAWAPSRAGKEHCGRALTLLWDDPDRGTDPPLTMGRG
ncbi:MAG: trypsin-like peptidase domain-containing protein [Catenulispora sp.]|nr:trypsin-like peptidase domain-containing protein [Catenulispora sp.]